MKTLNTMKVVTWLPVFSGFYGTIWETDGAEENELDEINRQRQQAGKPEISWDDVVWSFKEYREGVVEGITRYIEHDLKKMGLVSAVVFQELRSPREYNFTNDSINVEIKLTKKNAVKIGEYLNANKTAFEKYLRDRYTSYSGFFSSYSNDVYSWLGDLDGALTHQHKLGAILDFILLNENVDDYEQEIYEHLSSNGSYLYAVNFEELAGNRQ